MSNKADIIAMNFEASSAVGATTCSQGGIPINGGHIQYWMGQAREARIERDTAMTDGHDRIAELNAEITNLRAERDAAARDMSAFMKELSDALLEVRPLGGSEMFTQRFGNYYADPVYCRTVIKHLHETLHEARKDVARLRKSSRALLATDGKAAT